MIIGAQHEVWAEGVSPKPGKFPRCLAIGQLIGGASESLETLKYPFWTQIHAETLMATAHPPIALRVAVECTEDL